MKSRKPYFIFASIIFCITSCNTKSDTFIMLQSKGLDAENLGLQTILFCNKDTGFIAGSSDEVTSNPKQNSDTFAFVNKTALVYKTTDGGKTWISKDFGEGSIQNIFQVKNILYAFKIKVNTYTDIYRSDDFGENWTLKTTFPNIVTDLFFIDEQMVLIAKDEKNFFQFYVSEDEGMHWVKKASHLPIYDISVTADNRFYYLSSKDFNTYQKNLVMSFDIKDSSINTIDLPKELDCYFLTNYSNQIKLCGRKDNRIAVYSLQGDKLKHEYSTPENDTMNFPFAFFNTKDEDYIIVGRRRTGDVEHKILKTKDNGKTWETINFKRDNLIAPFYFLNDSNKMTAWFFAGAGKFQVLQ